MQLKGFTSLFLLLGFTGYFPSISVSRKTYFLFQITAAIVSSEPAPDTRVRFLLLPGPGEGKPSTVYTSTGAPALLRGDAALPGSKSTRDGGGHRVRGFLTSFPSNGTQTKRSESGGAALAHAHLFMKTLCVDLGSSRQSSRGSCLFKSVSSQVKFVALMNGRAESSINGQRKITLICIQ